ncbi:hypothetical protein RIF29_13284 [Crotalaria pallida]|uniref:procollagen-proline 4-dioxygenase n=1 Tax=Crotalaria pallida TaxID=3830 RepID=A0AAN9IPA4_CROPI
MKFECNFFPSRPILQCTIILMKERGRVILYRQLVSNLDFNLIPFHLQQSTGMASLSLLLTLFVLASSPLTSFSDSISSRKELRNKEEEDEESALKKKSEQHTVNLNLNPNRIDPSRVVQISWQPRSELVENTASYYESVFSFFIALQIFCGNSDDGYPCCYRVFLYKDFLSEKECDYLIYLAKEKSSGNDHHSEDAAANGRLTSETLLEVEDDIVARIEERISVWTFLPKENSKRLQVMHYGVEHNGHNLGYFSNKTILESTEPLLATVVLYLSNATQGGQILFPESQSKISSWSDCRQSSKILQPAKGNAILFFSLHLNTAPDKSSFHARCPVLKGDMWSAIKFFYTKSVGGGKVSTVSYGDECTDEDDQCPAWAAIGECQRNPVYMVGSPDYYGTCRKSCNAC